MSLLLDALKRAEQEKLARQGEGVPHGAPHGMPHAASAAPAASSAPAGTLELQPINNSSAAPSPASTATRGDAQTAQAMFQAKEPPAAAPPQRRMTAVWVAGGVIVLAILIAGGYVWYQVQSFRPANVTTLRPRPAPVAAAPVETQPKLDLVLPPLPGKVDGTAPATGSLPPFTPVAPPPPSAPAPVSQGPATPAPAPQPQPHSQAPDNLVRAPVTAPPPPLRLEPGVEKPRIAPEVARGYQALRQGDIAGARRSYNVALSADAQNLDALLGIATVEARAGNRMMAASFYRKALDVDPRNATALAGLASLGDFSQPDGLEAQLRADIERMPASAGLHFTLGNLFAQQSRWGEAQSAYFEAYRLDPANADYVFNLAVSLDHLGQARLAADNYRRALDMARTQGAQFDPAPVARRLAELGGAR